VAGYVINVGKTTQTRTCSNTIDFYLANSRGQQIRVMLWAGLGDMLIQKRTRRVGLYPVIITVVLVKLYNNRLYLSSTSSTLIIDDEKIPVLKQMKTDDSGVELTKEILPMDNAAPKPRNLENLLMWARNQKYDSATFLCDVKIDKVRTKKCWNCLSYGREKFKKPNEPLTMHLELPTCRYMLELKIFDDAVEVVVVMFNETTTSLLGCSASCILDTEEQVYFLAPYNLTNMFTYLHLQDEEHHSGFPTALANIVGTTHTLELKSHTYFEHGNYKSFTCRNIVKTEDGEGGEGGASFGTVAVNEAFKVSMPKRVSKTPSIATPSKPSEGKKRREGVEDSDAEESFVEESIPKEGGVACSSDIRKRRRVVLDELEDRAPTRDIIVSNKDSGLQRILELHLSYMELQYPLLFPYREDGYHDKISYHSNTGTHKTNRGYVTMKECYVYVIQYRKDQGTTLLIGGRLRQKDRSVPYFYKRSKTPDYIDDIISAELPSPTDDLVGYKVVTDYMLHGPCGKDARYIACNVEGKCSKHFPKAFCAEKIIDQDGYPIYRQRDNKVYVFTYDNKYVVPHNRYLLLKYPAHINVEWCKRSKAIKYLCKYLNKGPDRATIAIPENVANGHGVTPKTVTIVDEIKNYLNCRYLAPCEAVWRILSFDIHYAYPSVMKLNFYLPNQNPITLRDSDCLLALREREVQIVEAPKIEEMHWEWTRAIQEASFWALGPQLRDLNGRTLAEFQDMPQPNPKLLTNIDNRLIREALAFNIHKSKLEHQQLHSQLNSKQRVIYEEVVESVHNKKGQFYFIYGPGDTGRITHSMFVIPLELLENSTCGIKKNTHLAELMQEVELIIWDEAPMTQKYAFEALYKTLRDILGYLTPKNRNKVFGGLTVLLGGDFRQILLLIPKGKRADIVQACIIRLQLWKHCKVFTLTRSMRVNEYYANREIDTRKQDLNQWVLLLGDSKLPAKIKDGEDELSWIEIPKKFLIKSSNSPIEQIVAETYPNFIKRQMDDACLRERTILTPRNDDVNVINAYMFDQLNGESITYNSANEICKASTDTLDQQHLYPVESLNTLNFPGMPPHALTLKKELPIMLLRNVNPNSNPRNKRLSRHNVVASSSCCLRLTPISAFEIIGKCEECAVKTQKHEENKKEVFVSEYPKRDGAKQSSQTSVDVEPESSSPRQQSCSNALTTYEIKSHIEQLVIAAVSSHVEALKNEMNKKMEEK
nr:hypothetical protein [Tanacetum cinerariifolium]